MPLSKRMERVEGDKTGGNRTDFGTHVDNECLREE